MTSINQIINETIKQIMKEERISESQMRLLESKGKAKEIPLGYCKKYMYDVGDFFYVKRELSGMYERLGK